MKYSKLFCFAILMFMFQGIVFAEDGESEVLQEKRVWNLLRDLKEYAAGRLKYWIEGSASISIPDNDANYVTLNADADDPNELSGLGFSFPLPPTSKISMVIVEMDFKWPSSKGAFKLTFSQNKSLNSGKGVSFSFLTNPPKIKVGKLGGSGKELTSQSLSMMGTGSHTLKLVFVKDAIGVTFDKKVIGWSGTISPNVITFAGAEFETIQITRFVAQVTPKDTQED